MARIINFEGRQISVPDDATDDEVATILGGDSAPAPASSSYEPLSNIPGDAAHFAQGMMEGAQRVPGRIAELGAQALDSVGLTDHAADKVRGFTDRRLFHAPAEQAGDPYTQTGNTVGKMLGTAPAALAAPFGGEGVLPLLANGAVQGGLTGLLDSGKGNEAGSTATGAAVATGLNALTHGAANLITPTIAPAVQALSREGVQLTPGQLFGGQIKRFEDRLAGLPIADVPIKEAQRQSLRDFGRGAGNIALGGLGPIPEGISGQAMSQTAHQLLDNAYDTILPQVSVTLGPELANAVNDAGNTVAARLPAQHASQFNSTLADVFRKMGAGDGGPVNTFSGRAVKDAYSDLGRSARDFRTPMASPNDRALGSAFGEVQSGMRDSFQNSDPWAAGALQNVDNAYRNFIPVDAAVAKATGNASGLEAGVFTPQQLRQAVVSGDSSVRKMASAQGGGPLQQFAENGINVLPSSVPDSGTAGRLGLLELFAHPQWAIPGAVAHLAYSRPVLGALNRTFAQGPSQGATALADVFRNLSNLAVPAAALATGGGK